MTVSRSKTERRVTRIVLMCFALLALAGSAAAGQEPQSPDISEGRVSEDYQLGPGDLLSIRIVGVGKFEQIRVSNSGKIHVPHVGLVRVYGWTIGQLEAAITRDLREKGLVNDPSVQVQLVRAQSKPVYILGEVIIPGQFLLEGDMHVLDLVVLGGGFNELATPQAYLYRRTQAKPGNEKEYSSTEWADEVLRIDFERIASGMDPDVKLQPGDVLYIPERRKQAFYVAGDVAHPGAFEFPQTGSHRMSAISSIRVSDRPFRVSEAVAHAGGPLRTAKLSDAVLVRFDEKGVAQEMAFDLGAVIKGTKPDVLVQPNDIIYVPGSGAKNLGFTMLKLIPSALLSGFVF
jgi:polysaccharide export outer membrane protein